MAIIQVSVNALDENCVNCNCMSLDKEILYAGCEKVAVQFSCEHVHMCTYIKNRIIRNENRNEVDKNGD